VTASELLTELRRLDVGIWADGDRLRLSAPADTLTHDLRDQLVARKSEILALLRAAETLAAPPPTIVTIQPHGRRLPLFAIPGHNGDAFCYVNLARELGADQPFYGLQPPGIDGRQAPIDSVEVLAAHYVKALRAFHPGPYLIAGYCAGGAVAFEVARQLTAQGGDVRLLVLLSSAHPSAFLPRNRVIAIGFWVLQRAGRHARLLARSPIAHLGYLLGLPVRRRREGADDRDGPGANHKIHVGEVTLSAITRYVPERYHGRITLILPSAAWAKSYDRPMRWQELTDQPLETVTGPPDCDGDVMLREPHVRWLAGELRTLLRRIERSAA
jgi:Thioesterase domain/TubC N-terminal docking domain